MTNFFRAQEPDIVDNALLRVPQREAFVALRREYGAASDDREVGIVLPVGCGKSGVITLTPFAFESGRVLVIAPNLNICDQLVGSFDPASEGYFYGKCNVLDPSVFPEPAEIRGRDSNLGDLQHADVVVTNIQQLQGDSNRWLEALPEDFFDLVVFDEAHHNVADSWSGLREKFPEAQIVNLSATPMRADGQRMAGRIIYSYPVADAIREGYVKRLKAVALNPTTLKFVRSENREEEIPLDEVRRLGEEDAEFRRSIVTSDETLATIIDAAIGQLRRLRQESGDNRHKIICSALNYDHCIQIKQALVARGLAADYVHSREASAANQRILERLANHELDAIIQVRKLGEGFDHPYLSVAAVCSIFSNLSPFVQYVGRIMRVVEHNQPEHPSNRGVVVFHAGGNIAERWTDFREFSEADQEYFANLLPLEELDFRDRTELEYEPSEHVDFDQVEVREQREVLLEEIPLLEDDPEAQAAIATLQAKGYDVQLRPIPITRQRRRQAAQTALDERVKQAAGTLLKRHGVGHGGRELDLQRLGRDNFVVVKAALDRAVNEMLGRGTGERHELTLDELDRASGSFATLVDQVEDELFNGKA